eukprot:tig00000989_g6088.t1
MAAEISPYAQVAQGLRALRPKLEDVYQTGNLQTAAELDRGLTQILELARAAERIAVEREADTAAVDRRPMPTNVPPPAEPPPQRFVDNLKPGDRVLAKGDRPEDQFLKPVEVIRTVQGSNQALVRFLPPGASAGPSPAPAPATAGPSSSPAPSPPEDPAPDASRWVYKASMYPIPDSSATKYPGSRGGGPGLPPHLLEKGAALGQTVEVRWTFRGKDFGWLPGMILEDTGEYCKVELNQELPPEGCPEGVQARAFFSVPKQSTYLRLAGPGVPAGPVTRAAPAASASTSSAEKEKRAAERGRPSERAGGSASSASSAAARASAGGSAGKAAHVDVKQRETIVRGLLKRLQDHAARNAPVGPDGLPKNVDIKQMMQAVTITEAQLATNHAPGEYLDVVARESTFEDLVQFCFSDRVKVVQSFTAEVQKFCDERGMPFDKARYPVAVALYESSLFAEKGRDIDAYNRHLQADWEKIKSELHGVILRGIVVSPGS